MIDIRKILILGAWLLAASDMSAQTFEEYKRQVRADFGSYKAERQREFKEYRDRVNAEYAEYMRRAWPEYDAKPAEPVPDRPEPPKPVVKDPDAGPSDDQIPFDRVVPSPEPEPQPEPAVPIPEPEKPVRPSFAFDFYGTPCTVSLDERLRFTMPGTDEKAAAEAWTRLSEDDCLPVVAECLAWRRELRLCDWGYFRFLERMTSAFFTAGRPDEARMMQTYILVQSGYKVRIARTDDGRIVPLLRSKETLFGYPYLVVEGEKYYVADPTMRQKRFQVFDRRFPNEQMFSLAIAEEPQLAVAASAARKLTAKRYPEVAANVAANRNLIDFYDNYPLSDAWNIYASASLGSFAKRQLYPVLQRAIEGKDPATAANMLINFVQTAFEYRTDEEQFGGERPLFADETLYYPYSDCEDRAILYSVLVRELLGLDVVLLHYPGHLATAVCFGNDTPGDHIMLDGRRYTVCDPTYIGASIGDAMPQFKRTKAEVVRIR